MLTILKLNKLDAETEDDFIKNYKQIQQNLEMI